MHNLSKIYLLSLFTFLFSNSSDLTNLNDSFLRSFNFGSMMARKKNNFYTIRVLTRPCVITEVSGSRKFYINCDLTDDFPLVENNICLQRATVHSVNSSIFDQVVTLYNDGLKLENFVPLIKYLKANIPGFEGR